VAAPCGTVFRLRSGSRIGFPRFVDDAGCFEILPRDVPFEAGPGDAAGMKGEGPHTGVPAALVEFDGEEDVGRL
jgi:hypothetical protein